MIRCILFTLLCSFSALAASPSIASKPLAQEQSSVRGELSQRSGLPAAELNNLLANCDANQQSMYFCAWRDQIAAEQEFGRILAEKEEKSPQCKEVLARKAEAWLRSRNRSCEKSATQEWGTGSMKPTAQALCAAVATKKMTAQLESHNFCK
jgi:uncharacterized protein YecT (DUF1311 family)